MAWVNISGCTKKPVYIDEISSVVETRAAEFQFHPQSNSDDPVVNHYGYTLQFSPEYNQPRWVAFHLDEKRLSGPYRSQPELIPDPLLDNLSPNPGWYRLRGYTPAPLVPAEFMQWSEKSHREPFYVSAITMQSRQLNSGIWRLLRLHYAEWTRTFKDLYIINGPVLEPDLRRLPPGDVSVPQYIFSVILRTSPDSSCIGFLLPQEYLSTDLEKYIVPLDSIESLTAIDFLTLLPDSLETKWEATKNTQLWPMGIKKSHGGF
jgi:endonuclease G